MTDPIDILIVGAGPVGCVIAEHAARVMGWRSLIVEKREHIAGNCFDPIHQSGLRIHRYGPHYFRTNSEELITYLSRFTEWIPGNYIVKASLQGALYPFPINLTTLEAFYNRSFTEDEARRFLDSISLKNPSPRNSEEFVLSRVGEDLYKNFYLGYTKKQWGIHPKDLDATVCGRIPVRFNRDERYVDHTYQMTPLNGFLGLFEKMIASDLIEVRLNTDYREIRQTLTPQVATVYCGPIDEYFDCRLGKLPWRSLEFDFQLHQREWTQPCVQINYPNDFEYTRSVEIKHVTRQKTPNTIVSYEYPRAEGDPYYPIPSDSSRKLRERYEELARNETRTQRVYFSGRLAQYRYMNTDEAIEEAIKTFEAIQKRILK